MRLVVKEPLSYGSSAADVRRYEPGETVEMPAETAETLMAAGVLELVEDAPKKKSK